MVYNNLVVVLVALAIVAIGNNNILTKVIQTGQEKQQQNLFGRENKGQQQNYYPNWMY